MAHRENNATQQAIINVALNKFLSNGFRKTSAKGTKMQIMEF